MRVKPLRHIVRDHHFEVHLLRQVRPKSGARPVRHGIGIPTQRLFAVSPSPIPLLLLL
jgi:hypothetical protein